MERVIDGPNDEKMYEKARPKVMHLLKQPTMYNPSLPELVQRIVRENKLGKKFMYRLALRSYGLLNSFAPWNQVSEQEEKILGEALLASAIVNLADDEFAPNTPSEKVYEWATRNLNHWHGQITKWRPRFIICGGTFDAVWKALDKPEWFTASTGMEYFNDREVEGCTYLDAPHPTARYPVAMVHTYLMASAKEISGAIE